MKTVIRLRLTVIRLRLFDEIYLYRYKIATTQKRVIILLIGSESTFYNTYCYKIATNYVVLSILYIIIDLGEKKSGLKLNFT